ncbi:MAG: AAA family ATPase, partial [Bacteroidia bacterium]
MAEELKYIKTVSISKLWDRFDIGWNLHPDVNILAGDNGSGKTTILECIAALIHFGSTPDDERIKSKVRKMNISFNEGSVIPFERWVYKGSIKKLEQQAKVDDRCKVAISEIKTSEGNNYKKIKEVRFEMGITPQNALEVIKKLHKTHNIDIISTFDNELKGAEEVQKLSNNQVQTELDWQIYQLQKA